MTSLSLRAEKGHSRLPGPTRLARMSVSKAGPVRDLSSFVAVDVSCRPETARDIASSDLRVAVKQEVSETGL